MHLKKIISILVTTSIVSSSILAVEPIYVGTLPPLTFYGTPDPVLDINQINSTSQIFYQDMHKGIHPFIIRTQQLVFLRMMNLVIAKLQIQ